MDATTDCLTRNRMSVSSSMLAIDCSKYNEGVDFYTSISGK